MTSNNLVLICLIAGVLLCLHPAWTSLKAKDKFGNLVELTEIQRRVRQGDRAESIGRHLVIFAAIIWIGSFFFKIVPI